MTEDDTPSEQIRWLEYEQRKEAWKRDNPGAWPAERASFNVQLKAELGL